MSEITLPIQYFRKQHAILSLHSAKTGWKIVMKYTNENCICIGEVHKWGFGKCRAYHCPIDGVFFWTLVDAESKYENIFGESAEEVILAMSHYCERSNFRTAIVALLD